MRACYWLTAATLFLVSPSSAAWDEYDYSNGYIPSTSKNSTYDEAVLMPLKFTEWYDRFAPTLNEVSTTVCNLSLRAYRGDMEARLTLGPVNGYCWVHTNCILETIPERVKASFSGTSILLGLAPTTLSVLGPSAAEIALLSLHRPFICLLLSLGAPAIYPGRFLMWDNPIRAHAPQTGAFVILPVPKPWAIFTSLLQYTVVAGAGANTMQAAYRIGVQSVSSWSCETSYWPMVWILLALVIHFTASMSLRASIKRKNFYITTPAGDLEGAATTENKESWKQSGFIPRLIDEVTISANQKWRLSDKYDVRIGPLAVSLQHVGAFLSVAHLVFGTLLFSSLLFISVGEAMILILRFIVSATVCRVILQFEVGGITKVDSSRVYNGIVQSPEGQKDE